MELWDHVGTDHLDSCGSDVLKKLGLGGTKIITPSVRRATAVQLYLYVI